ncbi:alpha-2-HS-glycoprotein-like protein [Lates japonicus]|uniref:Alpha-2-HS-glycoprotein-like protein n=1 Tax=Lates japonicus TaxID=270547 RepID=A0AAD3NHK8_LATJO|nr:alpha-2-HS-glycoprotein-like protein [Lates japonicus]
MHHINEHHDHGYKFRLNEIQGNKVVKVGEGCDVTLQLDLLETVCHTVNPKHFEDCEIRQETDQQVMANCTVMVTVETGDAKITKYECGTRQVKSNREMVRICPDCPILIPLNSPEGLNSVNEAVKEFNKNNTNQHYYTLQEVGRIRSGYMMMAGMSYYAEFALVETNCPMGSRIIPEACKPLCPDRAHHAFCRSSYSRGNGLGSVECEFYPPLNTTALGPGEQEPICRHSPIPRGPPSHAGGGGSPPHAGGGGPPPHAGGEGPPPMPVAEDVLLTPVAEDLLLMPVVKDLLPMPVAEDLLPMPVAEDLLPMPVAEDLLLMPVERECTPSNLPSLPWIPDQY